MYFQTFLNKSRKPEHFPIFYQNINKIKYRIICFHRKIYSRVTKLKPSIKQKELYYILLIFIRYNIFEKISFYFHFLFC